MPTATTPEEFLAQRRSRLGRLVQRRLLPVANGAQVSPERRTFLLEEAHDLYYDELAWEKLTDDEDVTRGGLVELTFPGFLAFVEGLLLREVRPDSQAPACPRPEIVEDILHFLAERCLELEEPEDPDERVDYAVTVRLMDLVLYRLHDIPVEDVEHLELDPDEE